jgi:predicted transglutaminase-like cysteine proteinase
MKSGRIAAAFILLALVLSPLKHLARELFTSYGPLSDGLSRWDGGGLYSVALLALTIGLAGAFALARFLLRARDAWETSGLAPLDRGVHGAWPRTVALLAGIAAISAAVWAGGANQIPAIAEAVAAALAVYAAVIGAPPLDRPVDDYDPLPEPRIPEPQPEPSPVAPGDTIPLVLQWCFRREPGNMTIPAASYEVRLEASKARYDAFLQQDHMVHSDRDYVRFVRDGMTPEVGTVSWKIREISQADRLGAIGEINNLLAFAQRFRYVLDEADKGQTEYPKFPLETLVEDKGDCEDHAILAVACLINLGYDARLVAVDYGPGPGHMALAVAASEDLPGAFFLHDSGSGQRFYYCEVTTDAASQEPDAIAFRMGDAPGQARQAQLTLLPRV